MDKIKVLADLHNTDYEAIGLGDYGKPGNYMGRQVDRWTKQYKASETVHIPEMEKLIAWLPATLPAQERTSVVHGDYRLDNMIFHPTEPRVIAVLDWELSTLGEPLKAGLARADAAVILLPADLAVSDRELVHALSAVPVLNAHLAAAAAPPKGPQVGFAGIGKPWKVERALKAAGCDLADFAPFADHVAYDAATLERLADRAAVFSAGLVTTEKDWVRLPPDWRARVTPWPVQAVFDDDAALDALLERVGL
jgi:hypothetical protein